ncbi:MAG TPA: RNA polymerase sigma factor [Sphingomicrobium sp.]|nr:RNA polymerase sigma factor [Sphingomicrobium sp.]
MDQSEAFERDLAALLPRLRRFAYGLSRAPGDADDLTQMTVERALRSRDQWQPGTRLDSWLYRVMRNLWIDTLRARGRAEQREGTAEEAESVGHDPVPGIEAAIDLRRVMLAMDRLPDEQREVVALIMIEGFGYREAADMLGLPTGTVSSRLVRGRTALLALLGEA